MKGRQSTTPLLVLACLAMLTAGCSSSGVRIADDWDPIEAVIDTFDNDSMWEEHEKERHRKEMTDRVRSDWLEIHPDGDLGEP